MGFADDYVPVNERIVEFRAAYPEGTLRPADPSKPFDIIAVAGQMFLAYTAAAYRTPDDPAPGIGCAWEPVPGLTNFTRNSELQNAESSAWGRAIIAVGAADAKRGIASAEDVRNRQAEPEDEPTAPGLRTALAKSIDKLDGDEAAALKDWWKSERLPKLERLTAAQAEHIIDWLLRDPEPEPSVEDVENEHALTTGNTEDVGYIPLDLPDEGET
jgi:hypothetical protein